jgi:hypothetical protein
VKPRSEDAKRAAIEKQARQIVEASGGRVSSERAHRQAVETAQKVERIISEKGEK